MKKTSLPNALARSLREFFIDYVPKVRGFSPHTARSYRDSLALLLRHVASQSGRTVALLDLDHLGPQEILSFLEDLETVRGCTAASRNVRLAAIHTYFRFVATSEPSRLEQCQRILAIPLKRAQARTVQYLEYDEIQAVLGSIRRDTPDGRRDYALLAVMFNTGGRVQEILDIRASDLQLVRPYQIRLLGKARKERYCPLWPQTAAVLKEFVAEHDYDRVDRGPLFRNHRGEPLTRFGVRYLLRKYCEMARATTPEIATKRLHPHSMRHSTAVHLLRSGVDIVTISHWLGHASVNTTNRYTEVDLDAKREAIAKARPISLPAGEITSWRTDASILDWLEAL